MAYVERQLEESFEPSQLRRNALATERGSQRQLFRTFFASRLVQPDFYRFSIFELVSKPAEKSGRIVMSDLVLLF